MTHDDLFSIVIINKQTNTHTHTHTQKLWKAMKAN